MTLRPFILSALLCTFVANANAQITAEDLLKEAPSATKAYMELTQQAMKAMKDDSLSLAETLINKAIKESPAQLSNALLLDHLGQIYERKGMTKEALKAFSEGLNIAPTHEGLLMDRASLYMHLGNEDKALADYTLVLDNNRDQVEALFFRAFLRSKKRLYRDARHDYEHLLELEPKHEEARLGLALLNNKDNRPMEAMAQMDFLVLNWPTHAMHYAIRGGMKQERRDYEGALADINKAISLEPKNADYYISRAILYQAFKKNSLAQSDFRKAVELGANAQEVANMMSSSMKKRKRK